MRRPSVLLVVAVVVACTGSSTANSRFIDALGRKAYREAYALTTLSRLEPDPRAALSLRHFEAFARKGGPRGTSASVHGELVEVGVGVATLRARGGPLPGLAVDGVPVVLPRLRAPAGASSTRIYRVAVIVGRHVFSVPRGRVTAPFRFRLDVRGTGAVQPVSLAASGRGRALADGALRAVIQTCRGDSCVVTPCRGRGKTYVLDAGYDLIVGHDLVRGGPMPRDGWAIAVTFLDQAQPPGLGGGERTVTLRARFTIGFERGRSPAVLERCWLAGG